MRFVLALYSVTRTVLLLEPLSVESLLIPAPGSPLVEPVELSGVELWFEVPFVVAVVAGLLVLEDGEWLLGDTRENDRRTRGESSASTWRAFRAEEARRWVGKGVRITLGGRMGLAG